VDGLLIRDARPADAPALVPLFEQLEHPASADAIAARVERLAASDADRLFVGELDGELVGFASVHVGLVVEADAPVAKLSAIVVDERRRGSGIGKALVAEAEAEARRRGCYLIFLTSAERRQAAHAFYRQLGYEETGRRFAKRLDGPPATTRTG
jgi:ribosomal protein S18 acetylase RimI-like enzyme